MDQRWVESILRASQRRDESEVREFFNLVKQAESKCDLATARVLMKTFSGNEDYGTQEVVCSVLASCDPRIYVQALLEELPRLATECPDWAEALMSEAVRFHADTLTNVALEMPSVIKNALKRVFAEQDFLDDSDQAKRIESRVFGPRG